MDKNRGKIIDFKIGDGSGKNFFKILKLYNRIIKSKEVELFCTNKNKVYSNVIPNHKKTVSKI